MKRPVIITLVLLAILLVVGGLVFLALYRPTHAANQNFTNVSPVRGVRVDYLDMSTSRSQVAAIETQLQQTGVNMVTVGAGRVDWTYFPWRGHPDRWSADVKTSGTDFLMEDSTRFNKWAHVNAAVDVLAPLYIKVHPETAALSWTGIPSKNLVGTMELVDGSFGKDLLAMINEIATYYPVNSITLTELVYYVDGYGPQDKAAYLAYTGNSDWPRTATGAIDIDNPSIGEWRAMEIGRFIEKAAAITHKQGKQLFVEVRVSVGSAGQIYIKNGTDFNLFLKYADRLVVWGNRDLGANPQTVLSTVANTLAPFGANRTILMIGLWDKNYDYGIPNSQMAPIPAAEFQSALQAASQGGATDIWITPSFLMTPAHWQDLKAVWGGK
jgi:hypothetical protein